MINIRQDTTGPRSPAPVLRDLLPSRQRSHRFTSNSHDWHERGTASRQPDPQPTGKRSDGHMNAQLITSPPVNDLALQPGPGWSVLELFVAESSSTGVIIALVGFFLTSVSLAPLIPRLVGFLVACEIALLDTTTGGCANPTRQFDPAVVSGQLDYLWVYLTAPLLGALIAVSIRDHLPEHRSLLTHRLCGTHADGSHPREPDHHDG